MRQAVVDPNGVTLRGRSRVSASLRALRRAATVAVAALMLMWTAIVDGRPSLFPDTALYYSQADYLAVALGVSPAPEVPPQDPTALPATPGAPNISATIDGARSPIWGLFLYGLQRTGGLWSVAAAQALLAALTLRLLFRAACPQAPGWTYLAIMAVLSSTTSLPFFATYMMPDVFAGIAGGLALLMLVYWDRLTRSQRAAVVGLQVFALCAHRSNLVVLAATGVVGAALLLTIGAPWRAVAGRLGALFGAVAAAGLIGAIVFLPIERRAGERMRDPPFLMARVVADGPGRRYLQAACARGADLALCDFADLPPEDSDTLLWSYLEETGVFGVSDYPTRLRLEDQERGFVLGALAFDPWGEARAAGANAWRQLQLSGVEAPLADPSWLVTNGYWRRTSLPRIIPGAQACWTPGRCAPRIPATVVDTIDAAMSWLSLAGAAGLAAWTLTRPAIAWSLRSGLRRRLDPADDRVRILLAFALTAALVLINAAVCGALSAPAARYEARLIWLIPTVVLLGALALVPDWARRVAARFSPRVDASDGAL